MVRSSLLTTTTPTTQEEIIFRTDIVIDITDDRAAAALLTLDGPLDTCPAGVSFSMRSSCVLRVGECYSCPYNAAVIQLGFDFSSRENVTRVSFSSQAAIVAPFSRRS